MRQPRKPINDFREIKRRRTKERKKKSKKENERKQLYVKDFFCLLKMQNFLLSLSSVKFVNGFDDSINFNSINFH